MINGDIIIVTIIAIFGSLFYIDFEMSCTTMKSQFPQPKPVNVNL